MNSLFSISEQLEQALENGYVIDDETGEVIDFDDRDIEQLQMALDEKIDGVATYIKGKRAMQLAIKNEMNALKNRYDQLEHQVSNMEKYLAWFMNKWEKRKFETARNKISFRASASVEIINEDVFKDMYKGTKFVKEETTYKPVKAELKKALQAGEHIEGANLIVKDNIQIK